MAGRVRTGFGWRSRSGATQNRHTQALTAFHSISFPSTILFLPMVRVQIRVLVNVRVRVRVMEAAGEGEGEQTESRADGEQSRGRTE